MIQTDSQALEVFGSYVQTSASNRREMELRRLAASDQEDAKAQDRRFSVTRDWTLAANALFKFNFEADRELKHSWYELGGPYDATREARLIQLYRALLDDSETLLDEIKALEASGRSIEGAVSYAEYVRLAREILEEESIRAEAMAMMPPRADLEALADAHLRSIGN